MSPSISPMTSDIHLAIASATAARALVERDRIQKASASCSSSSSSSASTTPCSLHPCSSTSSSTLSVRCNMALGAIKFLDLCDDVIWAIFSHCDYRSLCAVAMTCRRLNRLSSQNHVWRARLDPDKFSGAEYGGCPQCFAAAQHTASLKERFRLLVTPCDQMDPRAGALSCNRPKLSSRFLSLFQSLSNRPLRLVLTGPGLCQGASGFVRQLLWAHTSPFRTTGMTPGASGVGAGITCEFRSTVKLTVVTVYPASREVRQRLVAGHHAPSVDVATEERVLGTADMVFFVVDATRDSHVTQRLEQAREAVSRLAFIGPLRPGVPLVVMSASARNTPTLAPAPLARALALHATPAHTARPRSNALPALPPPRRPWSIFPVDVNTLDGASRATDWAVRMRRRALL